MKGLMVNAFNIKNENTHGFDLRFWLPGVGYFRFIHRSLRRFFLLRTERPKYHGEDCCSDDRFLPARFESA